MKKQQQKERQARSHSSPSRKDQTKIKSSQRTKKLVPSNRERKGENDDIQQHNRFGSLSDSSDDMELGEAPDRPRTNIKADLGGSVGCAVRLESRRSRVQPPPRSATFFRGD